LVARLNNALSGKSCSVFQIIRVTRAAGLLLGLKRAIFNAAASQNVREMWFSPGGASLARSLRGNISDGVANNTD